MGWSLIFNMTSRNPLALDLKTPFHSHRSLSWRVKDGNLPREGSQWWFKKWSLGLVSFLLRDINFQLIFLVFSSVQSLSRVRLCNPMDCSTPGLPVHHQVLELAQTHRIGDTIQPSHPLSSPSPAPSIFPSIRVFSNESVLRIRWPKYWSFSFSISPSNIYLGLISFRIDWLDPLAVQGILKSLQHHSSKAPILQCSAFFIVQLSHPNMTTGKTIALTRWNFVGKVISLLNITYYSKFLLTIPIS